MTLGLDGAAGWLAPEPRAGGLGVGRDLLIHLAPSREVSVGANLLALGIPNIDT